jgi:N-acetylmuramoyl-L-alanine amidase
MSTGIKNGKHHTINIYIVILFFLSFSVLSVSSFANGSKSEKGWVIVIDAGHGGKDPGALGSISREKDINLAIALKTGEYILKNIRNATVIYTRKDDSKVDLVDRPKIANKVNADLFISIHTNWANSKKVMGAETYIMGIAKDQANLEVAMKENDAMLREDDYSEKKYDGFDPKSSESYIRFSLTQNVFQEQSTILASKVQTEFRERVNRNDRDVKQAGFWVLYNTKMPSILIETGFITNPIEEKYLNSKEGQEYVASSIGRACKDYLYEIDRKSGISSVEKTDAVINTDTVVKNDLQPDEIVFMVQVKTSSSRIELKPENFKGLKDLTEIHSNDRFKYASGSFTDYPSAVDYRKKLWTVFPDAFVIAVKDNKILPLQQALEQKKKK